MSTALGNGVPSLVYSPLCDSHPGLYLAYLFVSLQHGQFPEWDHEGKRCGGYAAIGGGSVDAFERFVSACGDEAIRRRMGSAQGVCVGSDTCVDGSAGFVAGVAVGSGKFFAGVSGDDVGSGECGVVGGGGSGIGATASVSAGSLLAPEQRRERNKRNRENKKRKLKDLQAELLRARKEVGLVTVVSPRTPRPYFQTVGSEKVAELESSRVELYIAENRSRLGKLVSAKSSVSDSSVSPSDSASALKVGQRRSELDICNGILKDLALVDLPGQSKFEFSFGVKNRRDELVGRTVF